MSFAFQLEAEPSGPTKVAGWLLESPPQLGMNHYLNVNGGFPANKTTWIAANGLSQFEEDVYVDLSNLPPDMEPTDELWYHAQHEGEATPVDPALRIVIRVDSILRHLQLFSVILADVEVLYKLTGISPKLTRAEIVAGYPAFRIIKSTVEKTGEETEPIIIVAP